MITQALYLPGSEVHFDQDEVIVSKTDLKGHITYANRVFLRIAGYTEQEVLGKPHSLIRHPSMPRGVFRLLWQTISEGKEIFAMVVNRCKNGDYYWVIAHVTPSFEGDRITGYHSNRRVPSHTAIHSISQIYADLLQVESSHSNVRDAAEAGMRRLQSHLGSTPYDEFVFSLMQRKV